MAITKNKSQIAESEQIVLNKSKDDKFEVLAAEMVAYSSTDDDLKRVAVNSDGKLKVTI